MRMPIKLIKQSLLGIFCLGALTYSFIGQRAAAFAGGPPASRTGAPGLLTFPVEPTCTICHGSYPLNSGPGIVTISGLPASYTLAQEVSVTVTVTQANRARYGFEAMSVDDRGIRAGDLIVTDPARTRTTDGVGVHNGRQYIQHITAGTQPTGANQGSWSFKWRAPSRNVGRVTFYIVGNAANGNGGNSLDYIYNIGQSIQPAGGLALVSAASFLPTDALSAEAIASLFGANLADATEVATTLPLPTTLAGTTVKVKDAAGAERNAPLFFVSPDQINFMIPTGTGAGLATITVTRGDNLVGTSLTRIDSVAPSLFAANASGQGVPAAVVLRINANGAQSFEPLAQFNQAANRFEAVPIDLGSANDQVFLVAFGSGLRGRTNNNNQALIGDVDADVAFVGAQGNLAGLDQANLRIPRSLIGRGEVNVFLTVDNKRANAMTINIK
jgi:uncharacterized protein (TIGR03437 family)